MVSISPTSSVRMPKLCPIIDRSPTGANSVVLKMKAASASATTASQLPWAAGSEEEGVFMNGGGAYHPAWAWARSGGHAGAAGLRVLAGF